MQTIRKPASQFAWIHSNQQLLLLLLGSAAVAVFAMAIAAILGDSAALLTLLLLVFIAVSIGNYRYGIVMAVVLLPLGSTTLIPREMFGVTGLNPLNATLLFSALSLGLIWLMQPLKVPYPRWPWQLWIYVGLMAIGAVQGAMRVDAIPNYFRVLQVINFSTAGGYLQDTFLKPMLILATAFLFSVVVRNARKPSLCLVPVFVSGILLPVAVIFYVVTSGESLSNLASSDSRGFLSVIGMHANQLGLLFNMVFALAIFCFLQASRTLHKWALGLTALTVAVAVALTFSRGAYLGLVAVVVYLQFTQKHFRTTLFILVVVAIAAFFMPDAVIERASSGLARGSADDISAGRVASIWIPLISEIFTSPIVGHGRDSILWSEAAQHQTILPVGHPHSAYIGAALDYGLVGIVVLTGFFWHMWHVFKTIAERAAEPIWRGFFRGAMACILLLLVQGVTDDSFTPSSTQPFLWLAYGIAIGLASRARALAYRNQVHSVESSLNR